MRPLSAHMGHLTTTKIEIIISSEDEEKQRYEQEDHDMDFLRAIMLLICLLPLFYKPGDCYGVMCAGELTVDKDIIPMGSNLTVVCRSNTVQCNRLFIILLNKQTIFQNISCSNVTTQLVVREPKFSLHCTVEQEGNHHLVCGRDIVADQILSTPQIEQIAFAKGSLSAIIHWQSSDDMELLKPRVRFRKMHDAAWMEANVTQLQKGKLLMLENLEPLTFYQFELRVCTVLLMHNCSSWSLRVIQKSPGRAPSSKLDVWRAIIKNYRSHTQNVTVLWKAFTPEDDNGDLLGYELVYKENGVTRTLNCSAAASQYTLQLPLEVMEVNVSAVTSAGNTPSAPVRLVSTGNTAATTVHLTQAAGGRIHLVWNSFRLTYHINTPEQTLGFVVEWKSSPSELQWKRIAKDQNSTYVDVTPTCTDTPPCTLNFSLYVESTEGVSDPAFGQIHLQEKHNPDVGVLTVVSAPVPAARGPEDIVMIGICLMTAVPIIILINLLYLKCVRRRIRKTCMSVGPSWLFENLPKLGNSNAIKLLQEDNCGSDLCWQPVDSDPPLSPVEDVSPPIEIKDAYPIVSKEDPLEERKVLQDWVTCPYKPQISIVSQTVEAVSETAENEEDEHSWLVFSPSFNGFDEEFFPSQGINGPLKSCLTVDGTPIPVDVVDGLIVLTRTTLEENIWRVERDETFETGTRNDDEDSCKGQTVLPSDLVKNLREPFFNVRPHSTQGASTILHTQAALHTLQVDDQLL
ncbi:hypothetical protein NFI96_011196 [Prochilodus magdalenae]|nr:hypothetical protein NFI96_011196 [Prochilodus magdalenae]